MAVNRQQLFTKCLQKVNTQIEKNNQQLASIKESMDSLDRHNDYDEEAKLLTEYEKYSSYLNNAQKMKENLNNVDWDKYTEQVQFGSVVETKKNYYFVATALGEVTMDDGSKVFVISKEAPIYEKLEGKKEGDTFMLKDEEIKIERVH